LLADGWARPDDMPSRENITAAAGRVLVSMLATVLELDEAMLAAQRDADLFDELGLDPVLGLDIWRALARRFAFAPPLERLLAARTLAAALQVVDDALLRAPAPRPGWELALREYRH
jgi:Phosphopantetheine attachment site